jgi:hypothetical protein
LAVPVAIASEMSGWRDLEPDGLAALVYVSVVVGLLAVGVLAGWRGVVAFIPVFVIAAIVEESIVYKPPRTDCDPFCSSPVGGVMFVLPFELAQIGLGIARARNREGDRLPYAPLAIVFTAPSLTAGAARHGGRPTRLGT